MASFLGEYSGCAKNRVEKFHRAVESFISQEYANKELIIVSDGCPITITESRKYYTNTQIYVWAVEKQPMFSGNVRQYGLEKATGDIVCYLDTDDYFGKNHLVSIVSSFTHNPDNKWIYYNDKIIYALHPMTMTEWISTERQVNVRSGEIGSSSIAHRRLETVNWSGCDGYGHDWTFVNRLNSQFPNPQKINGAEYYVCHIPMTADV